MDHIDGHFVVPDVFMKNKYGSNAQYNYDIKEQEHVDHDYLLSKKTDSNQKKKQIEIASPMEESLREGERSPVNEDYMKKSPTFKKVDFIVELLFSQFVRLRFK